MVPIAPVPVGSGIRPNRYARDNVVYSSVLVYNVCTLYDSNAALQSVSCAAGAEEGNVDAWISSLVMNRAMDYEISRGFPPVETLKVSRRFATVSVDTLPSKYYDHLEHVYRYRNIRLRQRIVTRFRRLFRRSQGFENTIPSHVSSIT